MAGAPDVSFLPFDPVQNGLPLKMKGVGVVRAVSSRRDFGRLRSSRHTRLEPIPSWRGQHTAVVQDGRVLPEEPRHAANSLRFCLPKLACFYRRASSPPRLQRTDHISR